MLHLTRASSRLFRRSLFGLPLLCDPLSSLLHRRIPIHFRWNSQPANTKNITLNWSIDNPSSTTNQAIKTENKDKEEKEDEREKEEGGDNVMAIRMGFKENDFANSLWEAIYNGHLSTTLDFIARLGVEIRDDYGNTPLHVAALYGKKQIIENLIDLGVSLSAENEMRSNCLFMAVVHGDPDIIDYFVRLGLSLDAKDKMGFTPLHYAAAYSNPECVKFLVTQMNLPVNVSASSGQTPLLCATHNKPDCSSILSLLLSHGADLNLRGSGISPLSGAIDSNSSEGVRILVEAGAKVNEMEEGNYPLIRAVVLGHIEVTKLLLELGADVNAKVEHENNVSVLISSIAFGPQCTQILIDHGADVNAKDDISCYPLHYAALEGRTQTIEELIKAGANPYAEDKNRATALDYAISRDNTQVIETFAKLGVRLNKEGELSAIHTAAVNGKMRSMETLIRLGVPVNTKNSEGWTALHFANSFGESEIVKWLLEKGRADIHTKDNDNGSALHKASNAECVEIMMSFGADMNARNNNGSTPLHTIAKLEAIQALIKFGADVNAKDKRGVTPLMATNLRGWEEDKEDKLRILLDSGADINARNNTGWTALLVAVARGSSEVKFLFERGGEINAKTDNGNTALMINPELAEQLNELGINKEDTNNIGDTAILRAVRKKDTKGVEALLKIGVDTNARSKDGLLPIEIAKRDNSTDIIALLEGK